MGSDVAGVYKSVDRGRSWRMVNSGIASYGIFSLAVSPSKPGVLYAATEQGLCKSDDGAEHWRLLPRTGPSDLRITGEKFRSVRCIAIDPTDDRTVYAGSPSGNVFKSVDGGDTWISTRPAGSDSSNLLQAQFGTVDSEWSGGFWLPATFPAAAAGPCTGFGFTMKGDGSEPREAYLSLRTAVGVLFRSRNLNGTFQDPLSHEVILSAGDFSVEKEYADEHPGTAKLSFPWKEVSRIDFFCVGPIMEKHSVARIGNPFFAFGQAHGKLLRVPAATLDGGSTVQTYGNVKIDKIESGPVYSVAVSAKTPSLVLAATEEGLLLSPDAGRSWGQTKTPKRSSSAVVAPSDPELIFASFFTDGVWKSLDGGGSWSRASEGIPKEVSVLEVTVDPKDPQKVFAIGTTGWNGHAFRSTDGAKTWIECTTLEPDRVGDPTQPLDPSAKGLSAPSNIAINPFNPKELFVSANWRPVYSDDAGKTWSERDAKADISVVTDIRFRDSKAYVTVMDEGALMSADNGANWRQMWPLSRDVKLGGHFWRVAFAGDRIVTTSSPWETVVNQVVVSDDDGKSFQVSSTGLPHYSPKANVMWDKGYPRALAVDPRNPKVMYLGIDGDPADGNEGGGIFKSIDAGNTWKRLPYQPASRRMFYGLAVDPTDSARLYWAACGVGGGLYRSEDAGASWKLVFSKETWSFNVHVAKNGTLYCPGKNLWRSADHGETWQQLTQFEEERSIVGVEIDPRNPNTLWISALAWDSSTNGGVYKTTDGGATWQDMTGDIGIRKPLVLRFNPATNELWAGGTGLFRIRQ